MEHRNRFYWHPKYNGFDIIEAIIKSDNSYKTIFSYLKLKAASCVGGSVCAWVRGCVTFFSKNLERF